MARNEMSGHIHGVVQAGRIGGGVHLHGVGDQPVVPRQSLPAPAHLVGRERELAWLDGLATPAVAVLKGPGGVGKTALATQWIHNSVERFPDGQLYANLAESASLEDVLGQFLRAFGVAPERVPVGSAERAALFRSVTARRAIAMLLDDASSDISSLLPASATSVVLVTSRRTRLDLVTAGALVLEVRPLQSSDAVEMLSRRIGRPADRPGMAELAALCDGLPIALNVAAAIVVTRPNRSLARTVRELRLSTEGAVRATFDLSYRTLSDAASATYRLVGVHPGRTFCIEQLDTTVDALDELVDAGLLDELRDGYHRCHDLVRAHARTVAVDGDHVRLGRLTEWYLKAAQAAGRLVLPGRRVLPYDFRADRLVVPDWINDGPSALRWFDEEHDNLVAAVRAAADHGFHELTCALADALQPMVIVRRDYRTTVDLDPIVLESAVAAGDHTAEARVRGRLARYLARLGDVATAERHVDHMLAVARAAGDRRGETKALKGKAVVLVEAGDHERGAAVYAEALAILAELDFPRAEALMATDLGAVLGTLGRWAESIRWLEHARTLMPASDGYNLARVEIVLAGAYIGAGDDAAARHLLDSALVTMTAHGSNFQCAKAHRLLAGIALRAGDESAAAGHSAAADSLS
jgi:tetratricopeptide (TPR) repeat protein